MMMTMIIIMIVIMMIMIMLRCHNIIALLSPPHVFALCNKASGDGLGTYFCHDWPVFIVLCSFYFPIVPEGLDFLWLLMLDESFWYLMKESSMKTGEVQFNGNWWDRAVLRMWKGFIWWNVKITRFLFTMKRFFFMKLFLKKSGKVQFNGGTGLCSECGMSFISINRWRDMYR